MINLWRLEPDPSAQDPLRFVLRLESDTEQLYRLLRRLGEICGRPRAEGPPFTRRLLLHGVTPERLESVRRILEEMCPGSLDNVRFSPLTPFNLKVHFMHISS